MKKKCFLVSILGIILVMAGFFAGGCWDRQEPENTSFIIGMGFDYDEDKELYEAVVQVGDPTGAEEVAGEGGDGVSVLVTSAKGQTPFEAVRNLSVHLPREAFFAHNKLLVISEELAKKGLNPVYDFMSRERQARLISLPVILKGEESITNFFRTEIPMEQFSAEGLERQIQLSAVERAVFPTRTMMEVLKVEKMNGRDPVMGTIELGEQEEEDLVGEKEAVRSTFDVQGGGIFKDDKLQGFFDQRQVKGWNWVMGKVVRATMVIECPVHDDHYISIEVYDSDSRMGVSFDNDNEDPVINLRVRADGRIQQQDSPVFYQREDEDVRDSLDRRLATAVENEIKSAIEKTKEKEVDTLGFGNAVYRQAPQKWHELEDEWQENLDELEVNIDVDANVRRTGIMLAPPGEGEK